MAIGQDSRGNIKLIMPASGAIGSLAFGFLGFPTQPGYVFALGLPSSAALSTTSVAPPITTVVVSGIDPTTFYAVVALLVIFIIATGFLAVRGRRPAS